MRPHALAVLAALWCACSPTVQRETTVVSEQPRARRRSIGPVEVEARPVAGLPVLRWTSTSHEFVVVQPSSASSCDQASMSACARERHAAFDRRDFCSANFPLFGGSRGEFFEAVDWPAGRSTAGLQFGAWIISVDLQSSHRIWTDYPPFSSVGGPVEYTVDPGQLAIRIASVNALPDRFVVTYTLRNTSERAMYLCALSETHLTLAHGSEVTYTLGGGFVRPREATDRRGPNDPNCSHALQLIPAGAEAYRAGIYCAAAHAGDAVHTELRYWIATPVERRSVAGDVALAATVGGTE